MKKWTIQISYQASDDQDKPVYARSAYWVCGKTVKEAYDCAALELGPKYKLGAIIPGHQKSSLF